MRNLRWVTPIPCIFAYLWFLLISRPLTAPVSHGAGTYVQRTSTRIFDTSMPSVIVNDTAIEQYIKNVIEVGPPDSKTAFE